MNKSDITCKKALVYSFWVYSKPNKTMNTNRTISERLGLEVH